jgi:hypothetical protein
MRQYGVLLSLLLGLRPRARHPSACVRLGDLSGVAKINLVLKTVSYYPQTEEWQEPPGWWTLREGTSRVFRSTLQGFESIDCRPLTVIWDYLPDWSWYPFMMELCEDYCWLIVCTTLIAIVAYLVMITLLELELKCESKDSLFSSFLANKPTSQKPCMNRGKVFLLDG